MSDLKIAAFSMQRNEQKFIVEWLAYHMVVGVDKFIIYNHMSDDQTEEIYKKLANHYDIDVYRMTGHRVHYQIMQHALDNYRKDFDWVLSIDMDEFYLPISADNIKDVLAPYTEDSSSALGAYWVFFGSNGHITDPDLVLPSYTDRGPLNHKLNHHMKPLVKGRGRGGWVKCTNPHVYSTEFGTRDLEGRDILPHQGWNTEGTPCHDIMRINHYWAKSYEWFKTVKQVRGYTADRPPEDPTSVVTEEFWQSQNLGGEYDNELWERFGDAVTAKMAEIQKYLD